MLRNRWFPLGRARILGVRVYVHWSVHDVMIAWGGVAAQLAVAIPILIVATVFDQQDFGHAGPAIAFLGYVNALIALVNLAPMPGLDGHLAWRAIPLLRQWQRARTTSRLSLNTLKRRR